MEDAGGCSWFAMLVVGAVLILSWADAIANGGPYVAWVYMLGLVAAAAIVGLFVTRRSANGGLFASLLIVSGLAGGCISFGNLNAREREESTGVKGKENELIEDFERDAAESLAPFSETYTIWSGETRVVVESSGFDAACTREDRYDCTVTHRYTLSTGAKEVATFCYEGSRNGGNLSLHTRRPDCSSVAPA